MPTYEYRCAECDRTFDVVQSFHDDPLTECPTCGNPVRKVFGNVGIVFKGSGFYKTDSRGKPSSTTQDSATSGNGDSAGSSSSDSDTKSPAGDSSTPSSSGSDGSAPAAPAKAPASDSPKPAPKAAASTAIP